MYIFQDAVDYGRSNGWTDLVRTAYEKAKKFIYCKEHLVLNYIPLESIPTSKPEIPVKVRDATMEDLPRLKKLKNNTKQFVEWIRNDYIFILALSGEDVASFVCFHPRKNKAFGRIIKMRSGDIWGIFAYTAPEYRGKHIYPHIAYLSARKLMKKGFKREFGVIKTDNEKSMKVHEKMGKKDLANITYLRVLGFEKCWINNKIEPEASEIRFS